MAWPRKEDFPLQTVGFPLPCVRRSVSMAPVVPSRNGGATGAQNGTLDSPPVHPAPGPTGSEPKNAARLKVLTGATPRPPRPPCDPGAATVTRGGW